MASFEGCEGDYTAISAAGKNQISRINLDRDDWMVFLILNLELFFIMTAMTNFRHICLHNKCILSIARVGFVIEFR